MYLEYNNNKIICVETKVESFLKYRLEKLYYAVIIYNKNRFSTILSLQNIDLVILDDNYKIVSFKLNMVPNTVYEDKSGNIIVILPVGYYKDLEVGNKINIK